MYGNCVINSRDNMLCTRHVTHGAILHVHIYYFRGNGTFLNSTRMDRHGFIHDV